MPGYVCVCMVGVCLCVCAVVSCCSSLALTQQVGSEKCFCARNLQQLDEPRGEPTLVWRLSRAAVGRVEWWGGGGVESSNELQTAASANCVQQQRAARASLAGGGVGCKFADAVKRACNQIETLAVGFLTRPTPDTYRWPG